MCHINTSSSCERADGCFCTAIYLTLIVVHVSVVSFVRAHCFLLPICTSEFPFTTADNTERRNLFIRLSQD